MRFEIAKNKGDKIVIEPTTYRNHDLIAVRVHWFDHKTQQWFPSKRGLTLKPEQWQQILPLVAELLSCQESDTVQAAA